LNQAKELTEEWREYYNEKRPHTALKGRIPREYSFSLEGEKNSV
jgi:transposase InsO family protein